MKKLLSLLMALAMVLSMATVALAADAPAVGDITKEPTMAIDSYKDLTFKADMKAILSIKWEAGQVCTVEATDDAEAEFAYMMPNGAITVAAWDDAGNEYEITELGSNNLQITYDANANGAYREGAKTLFVKLDCTFEDTDATNSYDYSKVFNITPEVVEEVDPDPIIVTAIQGAIDSKSPIATINLSELTTPGVVTAADWKYITNTWFSDWYESFDFLGLDLKFVWSDTNTTFTIKSDDLDYTWNKAVDFRETTGLVNYEGKNDAEMYNIIRKLTGDTKNPYVFGFAQVDNIKDRGTDVPKMTISKVIPQSWINYYGHTNLTMFAWDAGISCDHWEHNDPKILANAKVDAATQTQRVEFTTSNLYKTIILSKATVAGEPTDEKTDDKNPETGANDNVSIAVVFAVISLTAAGALVFKKASR